MANGTTNDRDPVDVQRVGRFITFLDAAVAIAMTLLILPLMEAVSELSSAGEASTADYLSEHRDQLLSFGLSFLIIATFWLVHHAVLREDVPFTPRLAVANFVWLLAIVVLPVSTALVGALPQDRPQITLYVGTMSVGSWAMVWITREVRVACAGAGMPVRPRTQYAAPLATATLFTLALVVAVAFPPVNYYALFLMFLGDPAQRVFARILAR